LSVRVLLYQDLPVPAVTVQLVRSRNHL